MIEDQLRERILNNVLDAPPPIDIEDDTNLVLEDILDSVGIFVLIGFIEADFGVEIQNDEVTLSDFLSVHTIADLIRRRLSRR